MSLPAHITARCSISFSVFTFVTFQFSDGRTADCAAALTAPQGGITLTARVFRPQHYIFLQLLQAGASSTSSVQPLASTQESNGTASSGSVSSPQLPHSATSPQVPAGPTRNVTGNVMSATLAEAATQLSFAEFLERALPRRPQPSPTLLPDAATQTSTQRCFC